MMSPGNTYAIIPIMNNSNKNKVLIVGGGFGGVKAALDLAKDEHFDITLLSDNLNFRYNPTLYHTATGGLQAQSNIPLEIIFKGKPITLTQGRATKLDRGAKTIETDKGEKFGYDTLIIALGMVTNYFGIQGLPEFSYGIKSVDEVERFKDHLHKQLTDDHKPDLNYIIVGGGPTGIELAGALPHYLKKIGKAHGIARKDVHIDLIEAGPTLVPRMPARIGKAIARQLKRDGVTLYVGAKVSGETADNLTVDGKALPSHSVVWTAGMANAPFYKENGFGLTDRGKVTVDEYLKAEDNIYVLGDNNNTMYSGMAQTAIHDGISLAENLKRAANGKPMVAYKPKKPIYVLPAGPEWAAVQWGKVQLFGKLGWALRSAADFLAYHDVEPWWEAAEQWMTEFGSEESCPTCATFKQSKA
jgi:NADH dehydrogenase